ncbi:hypothetical protein ACHAWF_000763 [Thalassiosira exigua]
MAVRSLLLAVVTTAAYFAIGADAFTTSPSRIATPSIAARPWASIRDAPSIPIRTASSSSARLNTSKNDDDAEGNGLSSSSLYSPLDRPLLAVVDVASLLIYGAISKSSPGEYGTPDLLGVLVTAFPFVAAWLATSPFTGVYSPDERDDNVVTSTIVKVGKGWVLALPLGVVLRGILGGFAPPPVPFIVALLVLAGVRILFNLVEEFFVEN